MKVYRLITHNSYEREMFDRWERFVWITIHIHVITPSHYLYCIVLLYRASLKLGLDKAVLQSMNTQQQSGGVSLCVSNYKSDS